MSMLPRFVTELFMEEYIKDKEWALTESLIYYSSTKLCKSVGVPKGFITDLASLPPVVKQIVRRYFKKFDKRTQRPAVVHDWLYCSRLLKRSEADAIFREALILCGVSGPTAWAMWAAVRTCGWLYYNKRRKMPLGAYDFVEE